VTTETLKETDRYLMNNGFSCRKATIYAYGSLVINYLLVLLRQNLPFNAMPPVND
jgi:hypothetical protein